MEQAQATVGIEDVDGVKTFNFGNGIRASYPFDKLFTALVKTHGQIQRAPRSERGQDGNRNYHYADLAAIHEATKKALTENAIGISQHPSIISGASITVTTLVLHESGQWLTSALTITAEKTGPKAIGSAITYARRYAKQAIFDIVTEDDDASAATRGNDESPPDDQKQRKLAPQRAENSQQTRQQQPAQSQSPGVEHLDPEHVKQAKEEEKREHQRLAPLRALKDAMRDVYKCKVISDGDLLLAYVTGDRNKTVAWLNNNPDKAEEVGQALSKWATENNINPEEALILIKAQETAEAAFPNE